MLYTYLPTTSHWFGQHHTSSVNGLENSLQVHPPCDLSYQYRSYSFGSKFLVNTKEVNFNHQDSPWERAQICTQMSCTSRTHLRSSTKLQLHSLTNSIRGLYSFRTTKLKDIQGLFKDTKLFFKCLILLLRRIWKTSVSSPKVPTILYDENPT